jgi:hypothetical protein
LVSFFFVENFSGINWVLKKKKWQKVKKIVSQKKKIVFGISYIWTKEKKIVSQKV